MSKYLIEGITLTTIADAIREGSGTTGPITPRNMPVKITTEVGVTLPELTNEGAASDLMAGKELIDGEGNKVTGTFTIDSEISTQNTLLTEQEAKLTELANILSEKASGTTLPTLTNPGGAENLQEGYQLIDGEGNVVTGTHVCESGSSGDGPDNFFAIQIVSDGSFEIFPFKSGMTWREYINSYYITGISHPDGNMFTRFMDYQENGNVTFYYYSVNYLCISHSDVMHNDEYISLDDTILSYGENQVIYTLDWYDA